MIGDMARHRVWLVSSCEGLVEGGGLYHSLVGKLLVRRGHDAEPRGRLSPGRARGLQWEATKLSLLRALHWGIARLCRLL